MGGKIGYSAALHQGYWPENESSSRQLYIVMRAGEGRGRCTQKLAWKVLEKVVGRQ